MKPIIAAALSFVFIPLAYAGNPAKDILNKYRSKDMNAKCSVSFVNDVFTIASLFESRASFQRYAPIISALSPDIVRLYHKNYDGVAEIFLIRKERSLFVTATWEDLENGFDASSFCELEALE